MNELSLIAYEVAIADLGWLIASTLVFRRIPFSQRAYFLILLACILADLLTEILERDLITAALDLAVAVINVLILRDLWKKRKRKGRLAALGNKARAKLAEMKRRMAERPARPVLRPAPQRI